MVKELIKLIFAREYIVGLQFQSIIGRKWGQFAFYRVVKSQDFSFLAEIAVWFTGICTFLGHQMCSQACFCIVYYFSTVFMRYLTLGFDQNYVTEIYQIGIWFYFPREGKKLKILTFEAFFNFLIKKGTFSFLARRGTNLLVWGKLAHFAVWFLYGFC